MPLARRDLLLTAGIAAALIAATLLGATEALGAHPVWAMQTGSIGAAGGAAAFLGLRLAGVPPRGILLLGGAALVAACLAVHFGKAAFAASFAENVMAGRAWYLGWFAVAGAACLVLSGALAHVLRR